MQYSFAKGVRYCAKVRLGILEQFVSNKFILDQLVATKKLSGISVEGRGRDRKIFGTALANTTLILPDQVTSVNPV